MKVLIVLMVASSLVTMAPAMADGTPHADGDRSPTPLDGASDLLYGTYFGGSQVEDDCYVDIDPRGDMYIAGTTASMDFPTTVGAFDGDLNGGYDLFAMKVTADGSAVVFSTYIGGIKGDYCCAMEVDDDGSMYIAGTTYSDDFPTTAGAFCSTDPGPGGDVFVLKLDPSGGSLEYSTFLGGEERDSARDIFVDGAGNALVTGYTGSVDFPTTSGAFDTTFYDDADCFVTKISPNGDSLVFSTFIGGNRYDSGDAITVDAQGHPCVAGGSSSYKGFPILNKTHGDQVPSGLNAFVLRLKPDGSDVVMSTRLGGCNEEWVSDLAVDSSGAMYILGTTSSLDFPTTDDAYYPNIDIYHTSVSIFGFVTKIAANGSALELSTYLQNLYARGRLVPTTLEIDGAGHVYIAGHSNYRSTPTTEEAFDRTYNGGKDVFLMKLHGGGSRLLYSTYLGGQGDDECDSLMLTPEGDLIMSGTTSSTDFPITDDALAKTNAGHTDAFIVRMGVTDTDGMPPLGPRNLTAFSTRYRIDVSWDPPPDPAGHPVVGYRVYRGTQDAREYLRFIMSDETTFTDQEVLLGVTYNYSVVAVNAIGPGPPANVSEVPWKSPLAPKNLTAVAGLGRVDLSWSPPKDTGGLPILGYFIYRGDNPLYLNKISGIANFTSFIDHNVTKNKVYYYAVQAFHVKSSGPRCSVVRAVPFGLPEEPMNLVLTSGGAKITALWDKPFNDGGSQVLRYTVYRGESPEDLVPIATLPASMMVFTDRPLVNGREYYYMVTAINIVGEGPGTYVVRGIPRGPPDPPMELIALAGNQKVDLSWKPPFADGGSGVTLYRILCGTDPDRLYVFQMVSSDILRYTDMDVKNGIMIYYAVQALNRYGYGPLSSVVSTIPYGAPNWPRTIGLECGIDKLTLTWTPPKDDGGYPVVGYEIYRGTSKQAVTSLVVVNGTRNEYVDTDVRVDVAYYYRIIVITEKASSNPSWVVAGSPYGAPTIPRGITVFPYNGRIVISWGSPVHDGGFLLAGYNIYVRYADGSEDWRLMATVLEGTNHVERGLVNGRSYELKATAFNDIREGPGIIAKVTIVGPPEPPSGLAMVLEEGNVRLSWDPPAFDGGSPVTTYSIRRIDTGGVTYILAHVGDRTHYLDQFAEPGVRYHYTVTATNELGDSEPAISKTIYVPEDVGKPFFETEDARGFAILVAVATAVIVGYIWYRRKGALMA